MKNLNLGRVLSKLEQRVGAGGCSAPHCDQLYSTGLGECRTTPEHFFETGIMFKEGCIERVNANYFNCWDDYCNAQSS